ncbi:VWA domain-containing protein [Geodermatophilus sp. SYSU D00691]
MGRHADTSSSRRVHPRAVVAAAAVLVLLAGGIVWWVVASGGDDAACAEQPVRVTVAPEVGDLARELLADTQTLPDGGCAVAEVDTQEPLETVADLGALEGGALPQVWVPDSSLWLARAPEGAPLEPTGNLASSPVVLATGSSVAGWLGAPDTPPTWAEALSAGHPITVPDLARSAEGISALGAVRAGLGGGEDADNAIVQAVLAASRGPALSVQDALAAGAAGDPQAPLVPVSEQEVWAVNSTAGDSELAVVYPSDGSPALDYPVLRVGASGDGDAAAVDAVLDRLGGATAHDRAREAGFRAPDGAAPAAATDNGLQEAAPAAVALDPAGVRALLGRLSSLTAPSRILAVFDVSTSMEAPVGDGTRATLARDAAKSALTLVPDTSAIGLWTFAFQLEGEQDYRELVPTRRLDADAEGRPQRDVLDDQLDTIPDSLTPGGTGLYDTVLASVRAAQADYNPDAVNSVLIVTDGTNEDDQSIALEELLDTLTAEADPDRPVKVIGVALGPDADLDVLQQIADATGGAAYSAEDPEDLQSVLFDALRQRQ